jgi:CheY-like chemotaxis protein
MMPDVNGFDVISTLKSDSRTINIPLIVCTAKDIESDEADYLNSNAFTILQKGAFSKEDLLGILGKLEKPSGKENNLTSCKGDI